MSSTPPMLAATRTDLAAWRETPTMDGSNEKNTSGAGCLSDFDSPWKEALDCYFAPFMEFFFPQAHSEIDGSSGICVPTGVTDGVPVASSLDRLPR